jgi:hypothetical protein
VAVPGRDRRVPDSIYVLRVARDLLGPKSDGSALSSTCPTRRDRVGALGILVFVLVLFGVAPSMAVGRSITATAPLLLDGSSAR